jgi:hypothetical protein
VRDRGQDAADVGAQEEQRRNGHQDDQGEDQGVLGKALAELGQRPPIGGPDAR